MQQIFECVIYYFTNEGAISYCEIGTMIPQSGGEYIYYLEAFGPLHKFFGPIAAFLYAWVTVFLLKPCTSAILSLSFAKYLLSPVLLATGFCMENDYLFFGLTRICATFCIGNYFNSKSLNQSTVTCFSIIVNVCCVIFLTYPTYV